MKKRITSSDFLEREQEVNALIRELKALHHAFFTIAAKEAYEGEQPSAHRGGDRFHTEPKPGFVHILMAVDACSLSTAARDIRRCDGLLREIGTQHSAEILDWNTEIQGRHSAELLRMR